jgi:acyl-CoA synthetase (AMP-forming)/AMP-acid ligase II
MYSASRPLRTLTARPRILRLNSASSGTARATHWQRDEMLIGGSAMAKGYYNWSGLNEADVIFMSDGWFQTGDIARWDEDEPLSLIESGQVAGLASTYCSLLLPSVFSEVRDNFADILLIHSTSPLKALWP